jgi:NAD-dependent deacetylase
VTQNIDTLHRKAGSERLVEVHGRADRVRCPRQGCRLGAPRGSIDRASLDFAAFDAAPSRASLPRCPACGAPVRAHVLWFDEYYDMHEDYQFKRVLRAFDAADLILAVGTSFAVGVTEAALQSRSEKWTLDPSPNRPPWGVRQLVAAQEEALPALVGRLALG